MPRPVVVPVPVLVVVLVLVLVLAPGCGGSGSGGSSGGGAGPQSVAPPGRTSAITSSTDYVVLVEPGLETAIEPLVAGHVARGRSVAVIPLSAVAAPGRDRAEEIRTFLAARCLDGKKRDLLLVGSPSAIPFRTCDVAAGVRSVVSDFYYADLSGDWDANRNGVFGELAGDAPDFDAELRVGRIPYGDSRDVAAAVTAIERARARAGAWADRCLIAGGTILQPGDAPFICDWISRKSFLPDGWAVTAAYPASSPIVGNVVLDSSTIVAELAAAPRALVFLISHGDPFGFYSHEPSGWVDLLLDADLARLPKDRPPVIVAAACDAGEPNGGSGLGERALRDGLAGFLGATTVVDPTSGGGAGIGAELNAAAGLSGGKPLGTVLSDTIREYARAGLAAAQTDAARAEVYVEAMAGILYGDPALALGPHAQ